MHGATLFEKQVSINRSDNIFASDEFDLDLVLGDDPFFVTNEVTLFDLLTITPSNVGDTFTADLASETACFPRLRPTGSPTGSERPDRFHRHRNVAEHPAGDQASPRTAFFSQPAATPDLAGAIVEEVRLRIDQFHLRDLASPGPTGV